MQLVVGGNNSRIACADFNNIDNNNIDNSNNSNNNIDNSNNR